MAIPVLLVADALIWYFALRKSPQTSLGVVDSSTGGWRECPLDQLKTEEKLIKQDFLTWIKRESQRDESLTDYLWNAGILNPEEYIIVEGMYLVPGDPEDMHAYMQARTRAQLKQEYNGVYFPEGEELLDKHWFMLKGCSDYGAEQLMLQGVKPWDFNPEW